MKLNRRTWYVRLAYLGEDIPPRTSVCALFWRVILQAAFLGLLVATPLAVFYQVWHLVPGASIVLAASGAVALIGFRFRGSQLPVWRGAPMVSVSLFVGVLTALLVAFALDAGIWCFLLSLVFATYASDVAARRAPIVVARAKAVKHRACPTIDLV